MAKYKIKDIARTGSGGTPKSTIKEYYDNGTIPWINSGELSQPFITETSNYITELGFKNSSTKIFPKDDTVLVAMYGATAGKASLLQIDACTNQAICAIMPDKKVVEPLFLKYKLDTMYKYLVGLSTGSARDNLSQAGIGDIEIELPDLDTQRRIASVLSNLDRKIALNRQINANLEALARQLYNYWFVQFNFLDANGKPYKSSGGKIVYNEKQKRDIPEGWEVKSLKDCLIHINTGLNPRDNFIFGGDIRYITVKNLTSEGVIDFSGCDYINEEARQKVHRRSQISIGDILFASICPLGRTYLISSEPNDWDINESVFTIRPNTNVISSEYLDMLLKDDYYIRKLTQNSTGSIFQGIRIHELESTQILVPHVDVIKEYSKRVRPVLLQKSKLAEEITSLTRQRDELLPLLMNGQVTVE